VLILYGLLLGPLLGGYMLFDKAFAYIHIPGTPLYVGEVVLIVGGLGVLSATGYLRIPLRNEPVLAILTAWFLWGFIRFLPGLQAYSIWAVRDFALCYYCLFAYFVAATLARAPDLLDTWLAQLSRVSPWLLAWLPFALVLAPKLHAPMVPFSGGVSIVTHEPGNAGIAALIVLGYMWLFPGSRSARSRAVLSVVAIVTIALAATQNRASLLGVAAGAAAGIAFLPGRERLRLIVRAVAVAIVGLGLAIGLSLQAPASGGPQSQARAFSAAQLVDNTLSIATGAGAGGLGGTVAGRDQLWSLIFHQQLVEGRLFDGLGFGANLPYLVGDTEVTNGPNPLRSPHNSHDDVLARMGLIGFSLWIALWLGWYWQLVTGCRRLTRRGLHARRQTAVLCIMVVSAILVTSYFSPQMEGAQIAALQWTAFGIGIAVTSFRGWFDKSGSTGPGRDQRLLHHGRQVPPTVNVPAARSQILCQEEKTGQLLSHANQPLAYPSLG
jgi:O-Antigen ligase